jgi:hypothetical protein
MDSRELVPGDVCEIKSDWLLPCDFVILEVCGTNSTQGVLRATNESRASSAALLVHLSIASWRWFLALEALQKCTRASNRDMCLPTPLRSTGLRRPERVWLDG